MIDIWRLHQMWGLISFTLLFCFFVFPAYGIRFSLALAYVLISAIVLFQNPHAVWPELQIRLDATAANSYAMTILIVATLAIIPRTYVLRILNGLVILALINCVPVLIYGYGIFNAASMDCTFIALTLPYSWIALRVPRAWFSKTFCFISVALPITTIVMSQGSTAYFIVFACLAAFLAKHKHFVWTCVLSVPLALGFVTQKDNFLNSNGRTDAWAMFMDWFYKNANIWLGTGTGSFQWIGPSIQGTRKDLFLFMHNEYLQAMFEQGTIGFALFAIAGIAALRYAYSQTWLFASLIGVLMAMTTQFPFRFFASQVLIIIFLRLAHIEGLKWNQKLKRNNNQPR